MFTFALSPKREPATPMPAPDEAPTPTPRPRPEPGPLEASQTPEEVATDAARRENLVATCMADEGFEYTPMVPTVDEIHYVDEPLPGTREYAEAYGYGGTWPENDIVSQRADDEHRLAVADMDCREATDWTSQHLAIELALRQEYVDAHLADLEALTADLTALAP